MTASTGRHATLHRMVMPVHTCPYGVKALDLLRRQGFTVDRRDIKCACVGGDSRVPLGAVSLTENLMMVGMAVWMLTRMA